MGINLEVSTRNVCILVFPSYYLKNLLLLGYLYTSSILCTDNILPGINMSLSLTVFALLGTVSTCGYI